MTNLRPQRATRQDVARRAGVSVAVVSYVVNDGPRPVAEGTKARVLDAILKTGYRPNEVARALALGISGSYGLVVPDISNPFFAAMAHALEEAVATTGKVLLLGDSAESQAREHELVNIFTHRRVDGLLYIGTDRHPRIEAAVAAGIPVVVLDRVDDESAASSVGVDNVAGARAATEHLISHGYTRIGLVSGPPTLSTGLDRTEGWHAAIREAGLLVEPSWVKESLFSRRGGLEAGQWILSHGSGSPQAIFAANEQQAVGLLLAASRARIRVPEDLAIITFDGTADSEFTNPGLSTVVQPLSLIAKRAVELLNQGPNESSQKIICGYELVLRASCGCPDAYAFRPEDRITGDEKKKRLDNA